MTEKDMKPSLLLDVVFLLVKVVLICLAVIGLFTFIYGIFPCEDTGMIPAVKDKDLVVYYRLDKNYASSDTVVVNDAGQLSVRRVVAVAGDTVDITENGLTVNGALQQESGIYEETLPYAQGISYPVTLKEGEVFLLGDSRKTAKDSRIYGPVKAGDTLGKVVMIIRHRGI